MPKLKKEDVIAKLKELEIEFDPEASYNDLWALLKENVENETPEKSATESVEEPVEEKEEEKKKYVNPFSSFESKQPMTGKAMEMKKQLESQPKVPVTIPLGTEEKVGSTHQVTLNGYTMFILKGIQVDVPLQVKEVLDAKFQNELNVRQHPLKVKGVGQIELREF